jgi:hypothetical protein
VRLTPHFTLEELTHSDTAVRLGIDNTPPPGIEISLTTLADGLEQVRSVLGHPILVHSGYRSEELERFLAYKDFMAWCEKHDKDPDKAWPEYLARKSHPLGWAADLTCPCFGTPAEIVKVIRKSGIKFDQLIEEGSAASAWCHFSVDPRLRGQVLTARFDANGVPAYAEVT